MRTRAAPVLIAVAGLALALPVGSEERLPARLAGHAVLPALSLVVPPADAPRDAWVSGKFTTGVRVEAPTSVPGVGAISLPLAGQPVQGLSGFAMVAPAEGAVLAIGDNGFGTRANSPDALLQVHRIVPDWRAGTIAVRETRFLRDPDRVVPYRIVHEGSTARYLTGGDFDPESLQIVGDALWIGDEFGPFLLRATRDGRITGVFPARIDGAEIRSPDHPLWAFAAPGGVLRAQRSGGFEGLALNPGTGRLWAMLERPLSGPGDAPEGEFLRILEFDPAQEAWTGRAVKFRLGAGASAIGDLNFVDAGRALLIERDGGEGDPSLACPDTAADTTRCFPRPARVKRVVLVDFGDIDPEGFVRRIAYVDLMDIEDPEGVARVTTDAGRDLAGRFTMPFSTIESVRAVDASHILLVNDNNLPFSTGRRLGRAADSEFVLLCVPELLARR